MSKKAGDTQSSWMQCLHVSIRVNQAASAASGRLLHMLCVVSCSQSGGKGGGQTKGPQQPSCASLNGASHRLLPVRALTTNARCQSSAPQDRRQRWCAPTHVRGIVLHAHVHHRPMDEITCTWKMYIQMYTTDPRTSEYVNPPKTVYRLPTLPNTAHLRQQEDGSETVMRR